MLNIKLMNKNYCGFKNIQSFWQHRLFDSICNFISQVFKKSASLCQRIDNFLIKKIILCSVLFWGRRIKQNGHYWDECQWSTFNCFHLFWIICLQGIRKSNPIILLLPSGFCKLNTVGGANREISEFSINKPGYFTLE